MIEITSSLRYDPDTKHYSETNSKTTKLIDHHLGNNPTTLSLSDNPDIRFAGGCIRSMLSGESISDYDIYSVSDEHELFESLKRSILNPLRCDIKYVLSTETNNATTYTHSEYPPIQVITRISGDSDQLIDQFDFTVSAFAYNYYTHTLTYHSDAMTDLARRSLKLVSNNLSYPLSSLIRVIKYINKGYNINASELIKLACMINRLDLDNPDIIRSQLVGIDLSYFDALLANIDNGSDLLSMMTGYELNYNESMIKES